MLLFNFLPTKLYLCALQANSKLSYANWFHCMLNTSLYMKITFTYGLFNAVLLLLRPKYTNVYKIHLGQTIRQTNIDIDTCQLLM